MGAGRVHRLEHPTLTAIRRALLGAQLVDRAVGVNHDRLDDRLAAESLHGGNRESRAVGGFGQGVGMAAVTQRPVVDMGDDLGDPPIAGRPSDRREYGLDLELGERPLGVGRVVAQPGEVMVDHVPQRCVADRVERQHRVLHAGVSVGPSLHAGGGALPVEHLGVGVGAVLIADRVDAALDRSVEQRRRLLGCIGDEFVGQCSEIGALFVGERLGVMRQRVEVGAGHGAAGQRIFELGQVAADPIAAIGVLGVGTGAPALVDQRVGGGRVALGRELPAAACDLHLGVVDERLQPSHGPCRIGQLGVIGDRQVGLHQTLHRRAHPCVVHALIMIEGCDRVSNIRSVRPPNPSTAGSVDGTIVVSVDPRQRRGRASGLRHPSAWTSRVAVLDRPRSTRRFPNRWRR